MKIAGNARDPGCYTLDPATFVWDIGVRSLQAITSGQLSIDAGLATFEKDVNDMINRLQTGSLFDDL
jgi:hypothetical protein